MCVILVRLLKFLARIYMTEMQTPTNMNDHNVWCGQHSQGISHGLQGDEVQNEQTTLVPQQLYIPTSQSEFTASYSDDLV